MLAGGLGAMAFGLVFAMLSSGRLFAGLARIPAFDPLRRELWRAARSGDAPALRRAAMALLRRDGGAARAALIADLDTDIFAPEPAIPDMREFARCFLRA